MKKLKPDPLNVAVDYGIAAAVVAGSLVYGVWCGLRTLF
jgi:hypothetical protein